MEIQCQTNPDCSSLIANIKSPHLNTLTLRERSFAAVSPVRKKPGQRRKGLLTGASDGKVRTTSFQCVGENRSITKGGPPRLVEPLCSSGISITPDFRATSNQPLSKASAPAILSRSAWGHGRLIRFQIFSRVQQNIEQHKKCYACQQHHRQCF
jgi:hypothetical protein